MNSIRCSVFIATSVDDFIARSNNALDRPSSSSGTIRFAVRLC
jgi:hypothetical protein